jgi:Rubrerythrin
MSTALQRFVGGAWAFRAGVEHDAALRFRRMAETLASVDAASPVIPLFHRASLDEQRHARLCTELSESYGQPASAAPDAPTDIAPLHFGPREALLYEVLAACCITETESVATLTTLLAEEAVPRVRAVLHEIAKDEVVHGQMGWAHLAREASRFDVSYLSAWVPNMLRGTVDEGFFAKAPPEAEGAELLRHGVLPHARKREVFVRTLLDVVFPGLERFGVDAAPARAWLEEGQRPSP